MDKYKVENLIEERRAILLFRTEHGEFQEVEKTVKNPRELVNIIKGIEKEGNTVIDTTIYRKKKA